MMRNYLTFILLLFVYALPTPAYANTLNIEGFATLPVMHEGRIKPIDSFARSLQKKFSGHDQDAMLWLTETLFNPALSENTPILKISNPDLLNMLELEKRKNKLFSYKKVVDTLDTKQQILRSILETPQEEWTTAQSDFIKLQENTVLLGNLLSSLSLFLPLSVQLPDDVPTSLHPYANKRLSFFDANLFKDVLKTEIENIINENGNAIENYTPPQQAIAYLSFTLANLNKTGKTSTIFKVIPSRNTGEWHAPWEVTLDENSAVQHSDLFAAWQSLALAFHEGNAETWSSNLAKIKQLSLMQEGSNIRQAAIQKEYLYNKVNPFYISTLLYTLSLLSVAIYAYWKRSVLIKLSALSLGAGAAIHTAGITARIYILERPPVSTLYESIIFVGLIAVLYGLIAFARGKESFWLILAAGSGVTLHLLGFSFDQDGDNLMMLTAVLNTNFWLATHVICITMGYAFCIITSLLAHYALITSAMNKYNDALFKHIHHVALLALLFSTVGTVLGGIWADQSWGRFWGWDPKENGALLIVLWLIWILHGRISGQIKKPMAIAGLAYLSVIVALSWFGVNLLSVGLHAYGFTDSAAWTLGVFTALETIIIGGLLYIQQQDKKQCDGLVSGR